MTIRELKTLTLSAQKRQKRILEGLRNSDNPQVKECARNIEGSIWAFDCILEAIAGDKIGLTIAAD